MQRFNNEKGQLGQGYGGPKEIPHQIKKLKEIVQIYCGDHQSFAVDKYGDCYAWGLNKNNCLLVNQPDRGLVKTIVEEPLPINLPSYFIKMNRTNIVQNN